MKAWLRRLHPFQTPEARRPAVLFAVVYFAQGMYALPNQAISIGFNDLDPVALPGYVSLIGNST